MPPPRYPPPGPGVPGHQMAGPPPPRRRAAQPPPRLPRGPAPRRRAGRPELSDAAVVSRSWGMAFATLISRLTGFARIVLIATILGAALSSAFSVAYQLPNLIAALVLEATFTAIFVPVLARAERDDPDGGTAFVRRLVTLATTLLLITTAMSVASAPLLVGLMLGDDPQVNRELTTAFAYLLLPQVLFYGLSSVFMAILNTRNVFGPPAWAPVCNNMVAIATLGLYLVVPGELSVDPVHMGNAKLLVLGVGMTLGTVTQVVVLLVAIRRERVSLRPLWGVDARLKQFGAMAAAMVLYVLISQVGLIVGNRIASGAAASGPAIYNYTWLVLMLPFGIIGVTVLTVVMPRLSRNAAANDTPAVLADLSLATRLTMVTLIPIVAVMTVGGPAIGSALFAYGNFGDVDAGYLGMAITLSAFTLIPYALVLLQLRVFYAREQPWTPIALIVVITTRQDRGFPGRAAPHRRSRPGGRLSRPGQRSGLPGRSHGRLLPVACEPQPAGRPAPGPAGGADHPGHDLRIADRGPHRPRRRPTVRPGVAHAKLGRRRVFAATAGARLDHDAHCRRCPTGRARTRGAGRAGRRPTPPRPSRTGSRAPGRRGPTDHRQAAPSRTLIRGIRSRRDVGPARRSSGADLRRR